MPRYKQRNKTWFSETTPQNAAKASAEIGSGEDGTVSLEYDFVGTTGNSYTITVAEGDGNDVDLSAVLSGTDITVTLGTDEVGDLDATKNTATLVAAAIDALENITATASGEGTTALDAAEAEQDFTGGQYATECGTPSFIIISGTIYVCEEPVSKYEESGWKSGSLTLV